MFGFNGLEFQTQGLIEQLERGLKSAQSDSNQDADERMETNSSDLHVMIPMEEVKGLNPRFEDARNKA